MKFDIKTFESAILAAKNFVFASNFDNAGLQKNFEILRRQAIEIIRQNNLKIPRIGEVKSGFLSFLSGKTGIISAEYLKPVWLKFSAIITTVTFNYFSQNYNSKSVN